jgi:hypothetical protein
MVFQSDRLATPECVERDLSRHLFLTGQGHVFGAPEDVTMRAGAFESPSGVKKGGCDVERERREEDVASSGSGVGDVASSGSGGGGRRLERERRGGRRVEREWRGCWCEERTHGWGRDGSGHGSSGKDVAFGAERRAGVANGDVTSGARCGSRCRRRPPALHNGNYCPNQLTGAIRERSAASDPVSSFLATTSGFSAGRLCIEPGLRGLSCRTEAAAPVCRVIRQLTGVRRASLAACRGVETTHHCRPGDRRGSSAGRR